MDLQSLFDEPIIEQIYLDPGYACHANDVWRVATTREAVIVRFFRGGELKGPFWQGCYALFGIDPRNIFDLGSINAILAKISSIPIPLVRRFGTLDGRAYVIVDHMPGTPLNNFSLLPEAALEELGRALAGIHSHRFSYYGHPTGRLHYPPSAFGERLLKTMSMLVKSFYQHDLQIKNALKSFCDSALELPSSGEGALIMIDIDPTQFLTNGEHLTALVDTEAYAIGPRELDFIALEYVLTRQAATAFARGYNTVLPLPNLSLVRPLYRYFYRLLEIQGSIELAMWMAHPAVFDGLTTSEDRR